MLRISLKLFIILNCGKLNIMGDLIVVIIDNITSLLVIVGHYYIALSLY